MDSELDNERLTGRSGGLPTRINLNLVWDYPVRWTKYKVLRDLVQNFYDAIGHEQWQQRFRWRHTERGLYLRADAVGFSHEWLLHIGASTKRDGLGQYAGYFGEGFKIAALCAQRDFGWNIELVSRDWELRVVTGHTTIEGQELLTLAYDVWRERGPRAETELYLGPFGVSDLPVFESVLLSFYYEANPLFGEKIWAGAAGAVFFRGAQPKPTEYPTTYQSAGEGIVFTGFQALGSFEYPLVVALHQYRQSDRERNSLYRWNVIEVLRSIVDLLPTAAALTVLKVFEREWYRYPTKRYCYCHHSVVRALIERVATDPGLTARFRKEHPRLLVAAQVSRKDLRGRNRRTQALAWLRQYSLRFRLVQDGFRCLGYTVLEDLCEAADGFIVVRDATVGEQGPLRVLEETALRFFGEHFELKTLPRCRILKSESGVWIGMAVCVPVKVTSKRAALHSRRFDLPYVALKRCLLEPGRGGEALGTYLHELAHMFGPDASSRFSHAMTSLLRITIERADEICEFQRRWDAACRALTDQESSSIGDTCQQG